MLLKQKSMGGGKKKNRSLESATEGNSSSSSHPDGHGESDINEIANAENHIKEDSPDVSGVVSEITRLRFKTNDVLSMTEASRKKNMKSMKGNAEGSSDGISRSKEEIRAERKAKAAEAKAKKAAAAAARKVTNASEMQGTNITGGKTPKRASSLGNIQDNQISAESEQLNASTLKNPNDQNKATLTGTSTRLSLPFRHVHFDMTSAGVEEKVIRQPSQTDSLDLDVCPAFLNFTARCASGHVVGIDAVCVAFIHAFKEFLLEYSLDSNRKMAHDLNERTEQQIKYLSENGPLPLALRNVIRQLKKEISQLPPTTTEISGKQLLRNWLDDFVTQNFDLAFRAVSSFCFDKIANSSYIITYSWCPVVERIILDAYEKGLKFHLCIIDSPIIQRGKQLAKTLSSKNIECTYGTLNAVGYVMKQCSMVLLGCSAILSNGYVVADRGASSVALVASAANVPVLVAAQTFKFADTAQLFDRSCSKTNILVEEQKEILPADLVTAVVTELRILHPSSAPAVLKAKQLAVG